MIQEIETTEFEEIKVLEYIYIGITQVTDEIWNIWHRVQCVNGMQDIWTPYTNTWEKKVEWRIVKIKNPFTN